METSGILTSFELHGEMNKGNVSTSKIKIKSLIVFDVKEIPKLSERNKNNLAVLQEN